MAFSRTMCIAAVAIITGWFSTPLKAGTIIYVKAGAGGTGGTWANAYDNLQSAISAATSDDQIWVAQGRYLPDGGYMPVGGSRCRTHSPSSVPATAAASSPATGLP